MYSSLESKSPGFLSAISDFSPNSSLLPSSSFNPNNSATLEIKFVTSFINSGVILDKIFKILSKTSDNPSIVFSSINIYIASF